MQEEIVEFSCGSVVNTFFVHYDNDGKVALISNVKDELLNNFEINVALIPNFISGLKDCTKYKIDYFFNIAAGLISDTDEQEDLIKTEYILHEIKDSLVDMPDIVFEHDSVHKKWIATALPHTAERLAIVSSVPFYVCKKNNPYFLIAGHVAVPTDLVNGAVEFEFKSDMELDLSNLSVYTIKKFRNYCIKEKHVEKN